jgi:hypothetical protein
MAESADERFLNQQYRHSIVKDSKVRICDGANFLPVADSHQHGGLWTVTKTPTKHALSARLVQGERKLTVSLGLLVKVDNA